MRGWVLSLRKARAAAVRFARIGERVLLKLAAHSPRIASIYYATLDNSLSREAAAVSAGRLRYRADTLGRGSSYYLLRRNIHRLEKGLIMRPRRTTFALDYLFETIEIYERAVKAGGGWSRELIWAYDVLTEYFNVVDKHNPTVAIELARFRSLQPPTTKRGAGAATRSVPYKRALELPPPVTFESLMALSHRRRSVRWYLDKPVERSLVDKAIAVAVQAPSACNRQPFLFHVIDDAERARRIAAIPLGTKGFAEKLASVIVVVGRLRAYPLTRDRHAIYIDASLSSMALIYAFETLGIATCPINWPDIEPQETIIAKELGLEADERVVMLIAYGWPDPEGLVPYSAKREHDQIRQFH